ncbi:uncharacterized protein LOC122850349 [Aphidius gifuensis]|uniref:uncharacterized protein LOC122850349 n=1 Tax=Aphidius gifuensis TaxID=684658 RepID=UPI001CDC5C1A|nr:uncharacterized protein LOC122850349 [Aphidius gifuensis]
MLRKRQLRIRQKKAKIIRKKMIRRMVVQERWRIQRLKNLEEWKKEKERERSDSTSSSDNWISNPKKCHSSEGTGVSSREGFIGVPESSDSDVTDFEEAQCIQVGQCYINRSKII